jgi:peptidyl-prolyl cis-trans isomerase SurA
MRIFLIMAASLVVTSGAFAQNASDAIPLDHVAAVVGQRPILYSEVLERVNETLEGRPMPTEQQAMRRVMEQTVQTIIDEELLVQRARRDSVVVSDAEVTAAVNQQLAGVRQQFQSEEEYRAELQSAGFASVDQYRSWLTERHRRTMLVQGLIRTYRETGRLAPAPVSERDVNEFFQANRERIPTLPPTVTFRQIVIAPSPSEEARMAARAKAESLVVELRRGGDFEQVARRESMDPGTRQLGGDLGWNRRGNMVPEFDRVMFGMPPGQISPVVETVFGFHIIRVDRVQPSEVKARHILIRPQIEAADVERARVLADSVAQLWRDGTPHDQLVQRFHDRQEQHVIPDPYPRGDLPPAYQSAFEGRGAGVVTNPFEIDDPARGVPKFVVARITTAEPERQASVEDFRQQIRQQLAEERAIRRMIDNLRREIHVSVNL